MKVQLKFTVPDAEFDPAEFSSTAKVWRNPSGRAPVGVTEDCTLADGWLTFADGEQFELDEIVHSTHFESLKVLEHDAWEPK